IPPNCPTMSGLKPFHSGKRVGMYKMFCLFQLSMDTELVRNNRLSLRKKPIIHFKSVGLHYYCPYKSQLKKLAFFHTCQGYDVELQRPQPENYKTLFNLTQK